MIWLTVAAVFILVSAGMFYVGGRVARGWDRVDSD